MGANDGHETNYLRHPQLDFVCLFLSGVPACMAINVSVQYNGGFLPDIILLAQYYYYLSSGNPFKCHEDVLSLQPMIQPKRSDIFPSDLGMLRRSRCVQTFL